MSALRAFGRLVLGILREIADENAYARHLARRDAKPSPEEWRRFMEERLRARYSRLKCC